MLFVVAVPYLLILKILNFPTLVCVPFLVSYAVTNTIDSNYNTESLFESSLDKVARLLLFSIHKFEGIAPP